METDAKEKYNRLFTDAAGEPDIKAKAKSFDLIAEKYYFGNFGSLSKSDMEVLMFSIYIERILEQNQQDFNAYSDYELSKQLGITQPRISNLKVKNNCSIPIKNLTGSRALKLFRKMRFMRKAI